MKHAELEQTNFRPEAMPWLEIEPLGRLLRPADVVKRTGLSRSQVYAQIAQQKFPPFIKLGERASAMPEVWLDSYIKLKANARLAVLEAGI